MDSIKQGDTLPVAGVITVEENGVDVTDAQNFALWAVGFEFRSLRPAWEHSLDIAIEADGSFYAELPSELTMTIPANVAVEYDMRVRDQDGNVASSRTETIFVYEAISELP